MDLASVRYAAFLAVALVCYYVLPDRKRWLVLLLASLTFYAAFRDLSLILALTIVTGSAYGFGLLIGTWPQMRLKGVALAAGISINVATLVYLKYLSFLVANLNSAASILGAGQVFRELPPLSTIGVSFYVFQGVSYLVDVYIEMLPPERHLGRFVVYMSFFPKLLQGPIERGGRLLPQLKHAKAFDGDLFVDGLRLILSGLVKKVVVAERLAILVEAIFAARSERPGLVVAIGMVAYAFQLYYDFAGYTELAVGAANLFGIRLSPNFNNPYRATSIAEFWRRWHISLSSWLGDYLFRPIQLALRRRTWSNAAALLITFLVCGIWHGAKWTYIVWGLLNGLAMVISPYSLGIRKRAVDRLGLERCPRLHQAFKVIGTFSLVCGGWVLFRSDSLEGAYAIFRQLTRGWGMLASPGRLISNFGEFGLSTLDYVVIVTGTALLEWSATHGPQGLHFLHAKTKVVRWSFYYALGLAVLLLGVYDRGTFIYFQF